VGAAVALPLLPWKAVAGEPSDVVDGAVAVIVETIADLDIVWTTPTAGVHHALVGATVAVVVFAVADLGAALCPLVFHAEVCGRQHLGVSGTRVRLLATVGFAPGAAVAGVGGVPALATTIERQEPLVCVAITVVVLSVAGLALGQIVGALLSPIHLRTDICVGSPAITQASIGGSHIRGHRVGPPVGGVCVYWRGVVAHRRVGAEVAPIVIEVANEAGAARHLLVAILLPTRKLIDAAKEAGDEEENEDGPRTSSTPWGHGIGFGDSPPFWAVVIAVTSAHCVFVFSFYKPQK
jgi:hypothetical protein